MESFKGKMWPLFYRLSNLDIVFIGYDEKHRCFRIYALDHTTGKVVLSYNIGFFDKYRSGILKMAERIEFAPNWSRWKGAVEIKPEIIREEYPALWGQWMEQFNDCTTCCESGPEYIFRLKNRKEFYAGKH